jgi:hypothetical protein
MENFKGSDGEWKKIFASENRRAIRNSGGIIATFWKPSKYPGQDERYERELKETAANQLLCSKAPDMLKMLEAVCTELYKTDNALATEVKKLIISATEI